MKFVESKKIIQDLVSKSESHTMQYDENSMKTHFIQPFFEALGWDFQTDVKDPIDDTAAYKIFQIDGVTRFYLKILPYDTSIESFRTQIESLVGLAYNKGVTWAIATNFKEMRVYNTEAPGSSLAAMQHFSFTELEYVAKFDNYLSDLTKHQFSLNVLDSDAEYFGKKPKRIPIDKQLLEDLLSFRNLLVSDIVKNNSINEENAAQTAQKILNRLIFIRSCGDRQIEERHLKSSLSSWEENKNKTLMQYLQEIFAYFNGRYGSTLFEKHSCDSLIISDGILKDVINGLYKSKQKAVEYNFAHIEHDSLGKMYENYLGTVQQKKDGAYYTPSYISKYICENTIIPYLSKSNVTTIPDLISEYENDLEELESKIHDIKILDPSCGTGEFLIRAIDVLLEISKQIQRKKELHGKYQTAASTSRKAPRSLKKKKSDLTTFQTFDKDIENQQLRTIIQNNIHGVDINEQAIEITQLNLFLKLATSSQKLIDISKNIRVGNSLVDDPSVDPKKAFDWKKRFPEKFDVVIGNPPYGRFGILTKQQKEYLKNHNFYGKTADIAESFILKILTNLKPNAALSFVIPKGLSYVKSWSNIRNIFLNLDLKKLIDVSKAFDDVRYEMIIFVIRNQKPAEKYVETGFLKHNFLTKTFIEKNYFNDRIFPVGIDQKFFNLFLKIKKSSEPIKNLTNDVDFWYGKGAMTPHINRHGEGVTLLTGKEIIRYGLKHNAETWFLHKQHLTDIDKNRASQEKITVQDIVAHITKPTPYIKLTATLDKQKKFCLNTVMCFSTKTKEIKNEFLLSLINSKFLSFYFYYFIFNQSIRTMHFMPGYAEYIPIPYNFKKYQKKLIQKSTCMLDLTQMITTLENDTLENSTKITEFKNQTNKINDEINNLIYDMFEFSDDEINLIEKNMPM